MNSVFTKRRAARFFTVQMLYQLEHTEGPLAPLLKDFVQVHVQKEDHEFARQPDLALFQALVEGVTAQKEDIDAKIAPALDQGWSMKRLDAVVRALLRAGVYEMFYTLETPLPVIINEYVEIAKSFFQGGEVQFVHAMFDKLGKNRHAFAG